MQSAFECDKLIHDFQWVSGHKILCLQRESGEIAFIRELEGNAMPKWAVLGTVEPFEKQPDLAKSAFFTTLTGENED